MIDLERFQKGLNELGEKLDSLGEDKYEELTEMKQRLDLLAQDYAGVVADIARLTKQVAQLTAERNEARKQAQRERDIGQYEASLKERRLRSAAESRVTELTEQVAQLTAERNETRATLERIAQQSPLQFERLESENARLTEALAAAEESSGRWERESLRWHTVNLGLCSEVERLRAENSRLTEQVAQLTAERNDTLREYEIAAKSYKQACVELDGSESEVARLTEALAAAESQRDKRSEEAENEFDRAEAAERDRDAARALPGRIWEALGELTSYVVDGDHMVRVDDVRRTFEAHLDQPAARTSYGTEDEYPGFNAAKPLRPVAPTPESIRAASTQTPGIIDLSAALQESLRQPAAPACVGCTKHTTWDDCPVHGTAPAPTTAEVELAALRERVAKAIAALTRNHVRRALEALRG